MKVTIMSATPPAISFDLSHWSQVDLRGPDAARFLNGFCTNEVLRLPAGRVTEAFVTDIKGRILSHVIVAALHDRLRLFAAPGTSESLCRHLSKYVLDANVEIVDESPQFGLLAIAGEQASAALAALLGSWPIAPATCTELEPDGIPVALVSAACTQPPAILLSAPRAWLAAWRESIPDEVLALGTSQLFEILRIESGFPLWGRDISADHIAQEAARTDRAISFHKGCYLGQEPIARLDAMGHTNKELRGLLIDGEQDSVGREVSVGGAVIGRVTSSAYSPIRRQTVALAMLRSQFTQPGTAVEVAGDSGPRRATVFWPHADVGMPESGG